MFKWLKKNKEDKHHITTRLNSGSSFEYKAKGIIHSSFIEFHTVIESADQPRYRVHLTNGSVVDFSLLTNGKIDDAFLFTTTMVSQNYKDESLQQHLNNSFIQLDSLRLYLYSKSIFNTKTIEKYFINGKYRKHTIYETIYFGERKEELLIVRNALEDVYIGNTNTHQTCITTQHGVPIQIIVPSNL
ncbi:hypothetical protein [Vibrio barjaei]|uniref:hypothetical protein n=1 Tax=Vibrio barjaei TaxID=1676683 RepID=UPI002284BC9C|nr:hypothetical protein [Vibrio barjaei]MCY9873841.1 hypothetical protein [Vibrio barjaei]